MVWIMGIMGVLLLFSQGTDKAFDKFVGIALIGIALTGV